MQPPPATTSRSSCKTLNAYNFYILRMTGKSAGYLDIRLNISAAAVAPRCALFGFLRCHRPASIGLGGSPTLTDCMNGMQE